jgi:hypothetical protein
MLCHLSEYVTCFEYMDHPIVCRFPTESEHTINNQATNRSADAVSPSACDCAMLCWRVAVAYVARVSDQSSLFRCDLIRRNLQSFNDSVANFLHVKTPTAYNRVSVMTEHSTSSRRVRRRARRRTAQCIDIPRCEDQRLWYEIREVPDHVMVTNAVRLKYHNDPTVHSTTKHVQISH